MNFTPQNKRETIELIERQYKKIKNQDMILNECKDYEDYILQIEPTFPSTFLHIDDFSQISHVDRLKSAEKYCSRAILRAKAGDIVVVPSNIDPKFLKYLEGNLGITNIHYIVVKPNKKTLWSLFEALENDPQLQEEILRKVNPTGPLVIHPFMGSKVAWDFARTLSQKTTQAIKVLAPLPSLAKLTGDKVLFLSLMKRICSPDELIDFRIANTIDEVFSHLEDLSQKFYKVAIRFTESFAGIATLILSREKIHSSPPETLHKMIQDWLVEHNWRSTRHSHLLITGWEENVCASPSAQLWIPPESDSEPIIESILDQSFMPYNPIAFGGSRTTTLPDAVVTKLIDLTYRAGLLLKMMGYQGRCSFDCIVIGDPIHNFEVKILECNGRWGGASIPMFLVKRIFSDSQNRPYVHKVFIDKGLKGINFQKFYHSVEDLLYHVGTNTGWAIVYNIDKILSEGHVDIVTFGETLHEAQERLEYFIERVKKTLFKN